MTTESLLVSATVVGTVWLFIIITAVMSWTFLSGKKPASERKQQNRQRPPAPAVAEKVFGTGLTIRIWKGAFSGVFKAGLTLLRSTKAGMRQTLWVDQCFDVFPSLLFLCDELEKQPWLLDEDREHLPLLRAAALAAEEVVLEAKQESRQANGEASLNSNAIA